MVAAAAARAMESEHHRNEKEKHNRDRNVVCLMFEIFHVWYISVWPVAYHSRYLRVQSPLMHFICKELFAVVHSHPENEVAKMRTSARVRRRESGGRGRERMEKP